jgi:hypothetical protein
LSNHQREAHEACVMECLAGVVSLRVGEQVFMEEYLVHFAELAKEGMDGHNSWRRIHEFP